MDYTDHLDSEATYIETSKCIDTLIEAGTIGENEGAMFLSDWVQYKLEELFNRDYLETEENYKLMNVDGDYQEYKDAVWEELSYHYEMGLVLL